MAYILLSYLHVSWVSKGFCTFYLIWSLWWFLQWWPEPHDMPILTCWPGIPPFFSPLHTVTKTHLWPEKSHYPHGLDLHFSPSFCVCQGRWHWWGLPCDWDGLGLGWGERKNSLLPQRQRSDPMPSSKWLPQWKSAIRKGRAKSLRHAGRQGQALVWETMGVMQLWTSHLTLWLFAVASSVG